MVVFLRYYQCLTLHHREKQKLDDPENLYRGVERAEEVIIHHFVSIHHFRLFFLLLSRDANDDGVVTERKMRCDERGRANNVSVKPI